MAKAPAKKAPAKKPAAKAPAKKASAKKPVSKSVAIGKMTDKERAASVEARVKTHAPKKAAAKTLTDVATEAVVTAHRTHKNYADAAAALAKQYKIKTKPKKPGKSDLISWLTEHLKTASKKDPAPAAKKPAAKKEATPKAAPVAKKPAAKKPVKAVADLIPETPAAPAAAETPAVVAPTLAVPMTLTSFVTDAITKRIEADALNKAMLSDKEPENTDDLVETQRDVVKQFLRQLSEAGDDHAKIKQIYNDMRNDGHLTADGAYGIALAVWNYKNPALPEPALSSIKGKNAKQGYLARVLFVLARDPKRVPVIDTEQSSRGQIIHWLEPSEVVEQHQAEVKMRAGNGNAGHHAGSDADILKNTEARNARVSALADEIRKNAGDAKALETSLDKLSSLDAVPKGRVALNEHSKAVALSTLFPGHKPNDWEMKRYTFPTGLTHDDYLKARAATPATAAQMIRDYVTVHGALPDPTAAYPIKSLEEVRMLEEDEAKEKKEEKAKAKRAAKKAAKAPVKKAPSKKAATKAKAPATKAKAPAAKAKKPAAKKGK